MTKWTDALKIWNKDKSNWSIPKKGTQGYNEVRVIMDNLGSSTPKQEQEGGVVNLIKELGGILSKNPLVKKYVKNTAPIMKEIARIKLSKISKKAKEANIGPLLDVIEKEGKKRVYAPVNKLLKGQMGKGHQTGGLIGTLAMIVAPFVIEGIINVAKKKPFFGDGLRQLGTGDESSNELLEMYEKELTGGNLLEDLAFAFNPSANVARIQLKKELKKMEGNGVGYNEGVRRLNSKYKLKKGETLIQAVEREKRKKMEGNGWGQELGNSLARLNRSYKAKYGETLGQAVEREQREKREKMNK